MTVPTREAASLPSTIPSWSWAACADLIRLRNQSGTLLLLWPSLWALWMATGGIPAWSHLAIFCAGAFLMRSAGVVLNDLTDRKVDRLVARTQVRPLADGRLSPSHALIVLGALLALAAAMLIFLPPITWGLGVIAVVLAAAYPWAKRLIAVPQAMLGIAFGWGAVMAWAAVRHQVDAPAWVLFLATVFWAIAYDTIYALQDREDDRRIGVRSSAIFFGEGAWIAVLCCGAALVTCVAAAGLLTGAGRGLYPLLVGVAAFLVWQALQTRGTVAPSRAFALFRQHVWVGMAILVGIAIGFATN